jgi:hypothetical protein
MSCEESKNVVYICKIDFAKKQGFYKKKIENFDSLDLDESDRLKSALLSF